jgi:hypothetical protein
MRKKKEYGDKVVKKGMFFILNFNDMDYMKDADGRVKFYGTQQEAEEVCGMYEFDVAWVCEIVSECCEG